MSAEALRARQRASAAQRPAADPAASVWVGASAGTGKTKVLTDRVLSLMLHGTAPARILCLTFTKAAAAEMANRLADQLAHWATAEDAKLSEDLADLLGRAPDEAMRTRARELFARVLDAPGGMKIQTIHAFCQSLLGRFPLEAGIAPHFQVLDERSAAEMLRAAREEVLADPDLAGDIAEVSVHAQEQGFAELMEELARERGRLARLLARPGGSGAAEAAVYRLLDVGQEETPRDVRADACRDEAFDHMGLRLAVQALTAGSAAEQAKAAVLQAWLDGDAATRATGFDDYGALFLTQEGAPRARLLTKAAQAAASGALDVMAGEAQRLVAVRARLNALTVARATAALLRLGAAILIVYERHKGARALLDYDDLILNARDLLARQGAASWVLFKLDGGLDHILIDEAQDTNPEQWEVIEMLSAEFFVGEGTRDTPRTVFAVGDAKQSIYSFQRADPAAFGRMREYFAARAGNAGQTWATVDLAHSFRSCAAILRAVDAVFAREAAREGVLFGEAALAHAAVRLGQAGLVELWPPAPAEDSDDPAPWAPPVDRRGAVPARTRLARLIARKLHDWTRAPAAGAIGPGHEAWLDSKGRRVRPGDVLVLVRRRNAFVEELVRELKRLDVPVAGVDRMVLRDQLPVMDLVALGRFLLLPEDDLTLASVLKGPLIGLSEEQLFEIAYGRGETSLWRSLAAKARAEPAYRAGHAHLSALLARTDFTPPHELFAEVLTRDWDGASGRARLLARLGPDANDPIEEFVSLALAYEREHAPSLEGFLHWVEAGAQVVKRDMDMGQDAVRVMTVHGAKGLQAPVVFLPDTLQTPRARTGVFWLRDGDDDVAPDGGDETLALWPLRKALDGPAAARARTEAQDAQDREYRRLLYVALTRAEDRLYVCGWAMQKAAPAGCWYALVEGALAGIGEAVAYSLGGAGADGWSGPGWRLSDTQVSAPDTRDEGAAGPAAEVPPLPAWARRAPPPEAAPPRPLAPSRPSQAEPAAFSPLGPDRGRRFLRGRLIHRLLQSLPDLPPGARPDAAERYLSAGGHGLSAAERAEIAAAALAVLETPEFAPLFGPGSRAEVPVVGVIGQGAAAEVVSGQVDRLVVAQDRVRIVDFKTNRPAPAEEAEVAPLYLRQMAAYRAVLAAVYPDRPIECLLLWSDGPRLMQLSDACLAAHAP